MSAIDTYNFILKVKKQVELINTLYINLRDDINNISPSQRNSQIKKILNRLSQINVDNLNIELKKIESSLFFEQSQKIVKTIESDINKIKEYIYSIQTNQEDQFDNEESIVPENKLVNLIRDKYSFLTKLVNSGNVETSIIIRDAKRLETIITRLNFENLQEGVYEKMLRIKNDVSSIVQTMVGIEKTEKYGPYFYKPLIDLIAANYTLGNLDKAKAKAIPIIDFIEDPKNITMFEPPIKRIIAKKMTNKEFKLFYDSILTMIKGKRKFESFNNYKNNYGQFYII